MSIKYTWLPIINNCDVKIVIHIKPVSSSDDKTNVYNTFPSIVEKTYK